MSNRITYRVEGMDCAACVAKVTLAVERLPGVSAVEVNLMAERLSLSLAPGGTAAEGVVRVVEALGYRVGDAAAARAEAAPHDGHAHAHDHAHDHAPDSAATPWWRTAKARLVWLLAALVLAAYALSLLLPRNFTDPLFLAATLVALIPFGRRAIALARAGSPFSIETLMCTAAIGASVIGAAEEAAVVVLLFALGELLESVAAGRARDGIRALGALLPQTAIRLGPDGTQTQVRPEALAIGERVLVRPGDRVPCDGVIEGGSSALDESPVTGESVPVPRTKGDPVVAGSMNADGVLTVRVTRAAADNTIARIIRLVEDATASRAPTQRFIERFARWWTPAAMGVSALVILAAPLLLGWDFRTSLYRGLAVLLIACPCALVISVPAAMASGLSAGARRGLLVKGGAALEALAAARTVAFDKTGTLTEGRPRATDLLAAPDSSETELLRLAAAVEQGSAHPLARAILDRAAAENIALPGFDRAGAIPGKAVTGRVEGQAVVVGSPAWAEGAGMALPQALAGQVAALEQQGKTTVVVAANQRVLGLIAMRDEPRADAAAAIAALAQMGIGAAMLTGDNARTAAAIAGTLGLQAKAQLLPADKLRAIAALQEQGPVVMVGDGINDAPALAAADVGVAMGGGTTVALEAADAAVLKDRVSGVAELVSLSRATLANVKQNVGVAIGLKGFFLVTTVLGVTGLWPAIMADTGATVLVTLNALRLLRWKPT